MRKARSATKAAVARSPKPRLRAPAQRAASASSRLLTLNCRWRRPKGEHAWPALGNFRRAVPPLPTCGQCLLPPGCDTARWMPRSLNQPSIMKATRPCGWRQNWTAHAGGRSGLRFRDVWRCVRPRLVPPKLALYPPRWNTESVCTFCSHPWRHQWPYDPIGADISSSRS